MKHTAESEGDFDDEEEDFDSDDPDYSPEADDAGVFWCPHCGAEMYGDSTRCPKCGDFVKPGARPSGSMPWWVWAGLVLVGLTLVAGLAASFLH